MRGNDEETQSKPRKPSICLIGRAALSFAMSGTGRAVRASPASFFASGAGGNITGVDPEHDLVAVMRWMDPASVDGVVARVMAA